MDLFLFIKLVIMFINYIMLNYNDEITLYHFNFLYIIK